MNKFFYIGFLGLMFLTVGLSAQMVHITKANEGFWIKEAGENVLFFQRETKSLASEFGRNNYFHPVFSLHGDTITEDFPDDHPHHRGIFWAWSQIQVDGRPIANSWDLEHFTQKIAEVEFRTDEKGRGILAYTSFWYASNPDDPFMREKTKVVVSPRNMRYRKIDFEIELQALEHNLAIGGSDNEKGYGGFSVRMKTDENTKFFNEWGQQTEPENTAMEGGRYINISNRQLKYGVVIYNNRDNPPSPGWILRQQESMQNCAWPGREPYEVLVDQPQTLKYTLLIHNGKLKKQAIERVLGK
ncbi:MAG: PmoA family protein [Prolixibacteraceae bacterium]|jgi:hypothetical protein|nr:PmoA family protein [Prolixibacteraceae bacterium]